MTTPLLHILAAFFSIVLINRLFDPEIDLPAEKLLLLSVGGILPDIFDKVLTGSRYPFHSLVVSGFTIILLYAFCNYFIQSHFEFFSKNNHFRKYLILISIVFISHPVMDLEGFVPLFYPLNYDGYSLEFELDIIQSIPPKILNFNIGINFEPFNYSIQYYKEGTFISTIDILFIIVILVAFSGKLLVIFGKGVKSYSNREYEG